ncbi:glucosamine inositolphosphorylceramide transferase family protein [Pseudoxanthomonas sp.]|uniref:glucosamine inositolphosphorylceramide transferase family protein n=1 Tax=Pseudoxanthomonas sp. TaxID=1871049 RepID=UPI002E147C07|nr:hypothetical protein [Pseudoxanthomonas sp.]
MGRGAMKVRTPLYATTRGKPLRVVLVGPARVPRWVSCAFELARDRDDVTLLAVSADLRPEPSRRRLPFALFPFFWLERTLLRLFLRMRGRPLEGPLAQTGLPEDVHAPADETRAAGRQRDAVCARVAALQPDLVLCIGPEDWATALARLAPHGCWLLDGDLVDPVRAGAALLSPILEEQDATPITLELRPADASLPPTVLAGSWGATRAVSFSQHRDMAFLKLPALLLRAIRNLPDEGSASMKRLQVGPEPIRWSMAMCLHAAWIALRLLLQSGTRRRATHQPWYLLLPDVDSPVDPAAPRVEGWRALVAPGRNYWADPFLVEEQDRRLLFVEEFVDARNQGVIACLQLLDDGSAVNLGTVLDEPFHLSYPQVFRWDDAWYMTVESFEADRVSLYRATDFPRGWVRTADLLEGCACVDPTLHHHEGRWYLFGNVSESGGNPSDELFLFVADALEGPYRPHPANPLLADVRSARPAGQLFRRHGRLYRPAQCCAPVYGAAVVFNEVLGLDATHYRERQVARLDPTWMEGQDGCHTFNAAGRWQVLDVHGVPPGAEKRISVVDHPDAASPRLPAQVERMAQQSRLGLLWSASLWPWYL